MSDILSSRPHSVRARYRGMLTASVLVAAVSLAGCTSSSSAATSRAPAPGTPSSGSTAVAVTSPAAATTSASGSAGVPTGTGAPATSSPATSSPATSSAATAGTAPAYAAALGDQVRAVMAAKTIPGAVVLVRSRTRGNWTAAFGSRQIGSKDPVTTSDVFRLADLTATMTATVILQLQDQGKLRLTDPVSRYVPGVPGGDRITLAQLGRYETGLYSYDNDPAFRAAYTADPQRVWTPQQLLDISFAHPAAFPAGAENYSNTNFILLGLVIEKVTGMPAAAAFKSMLFDPLKLADIGLSTGAGTLPDPQPHGYAYTPDPLTDPTLSSAQRAAAAAGTLLPTDRTTESPSWAWTAGAAYGDAADVASFFTAVVDGKLLSAKAQAERVADLDAIGPDDPTGVQYGFGIARYGQYFTYSGAMPGYSSLAAYDPATGTTIVVLTTLMWAPDGGSTVSSIFHAVTAAVGPVRQPSS